MVMEKVMCDKFTTILADDLVPALGCTEPIAVALAAAKAHEVLGEDARHMELFCSGNIIKNVKGVTVPNSGGMKGADVAAVLGYAGGKSDLDLQVLESVTQQDVFRTKELLQNNFCNQQLVPGVANLYVRVELEGSEHTASVTIKDKHNHISNITKDGVVLLEDDAAGEAGIHGDKSLLNIHSIVDYARSVDLEDVKPILNRQIEYNTAISKEGLTNNWGASVGKTILETYGDDIKFRARAAAAAGSDARMSGCSLPVVTNSGSGNQGMTVSLPVIEYAKELGSSEETLYRALCISNLISMHIKKYIGSLSAFCGAVSAACGAGSAIVFMMGGGENEIGQTIVNTLANVGGIVCDGAKPSCAAKISSAVEAAILGFTMTQKNRRFVDGEGLVKEDPEKTIEAFGRMGRDGMKSTDIEILNIMIGK